VNRKASASAKTRPTLRLVGGHEAVAVGLRETCRRIGLSYGYGQRLTMVGTFPVPHLPRIGRLGHFRFSTVEINRYLADASTQDARVRRR